MRELGMKIYLLISDQQSGPFSLENVHNMKRLGTLPPETFAACEGQEQWLPLGEFLVLYPLPSTQRPPSKARPQPPKKSRLRGLVAALVAAIIGGAIMATFAAVYGVLIPVLWFPMGWITGFVAAESSHVQEDQAMGALAAGTTLLGILLSLIGFGMHHGRGAVILGALGTLISFFGAPWLAFRTGTSPIPT
jgi:GYF domain 2